MGSWMSSNRLVTNTARPSHRLLAGCLVLVAAVACGGPARATDATLKATYFIALAGFPIGRASVDSWLTDTEYATIIEGSTFGLTRLVSDSRAVLIGNGSIDGTEILPATYSYLTSEGGSESRVTMALSDHAVVELDADPELSDSPDRIPLTEDHRRRIVDPVSAFIVSLADSTHPDGETVCRRTVPVFDGWQRFDVKLDYKRTETVDGRGDSYSGPVIVCGARYVPVAGHRMSREAIEYMAKNERLEVWMAPVANTTLMVPHRIVIGTKIGDLTVYAREFVVTASERQARVD